MATGLLGRKVGMTHIFTADGDCIPVTVLQMGPCTVIRRKTAEKDGYDAVVLGFGPVDEKHARRLTKPEVGVFKKAGTGIFRHVKEVRVKDAKLLGELKAGDVLTVDKVFRQDQRIDVAGITKGRGFAGVEDYLDGPFNNAAKSKIRKVALHPHCKKCLNQIRRLLS